MATSNDNIYLLRHYLKNYYPEYNFEFIKTLEDELDFYRKKIYLNDSDLNLFDEDIDLLIDPTVKLLNNILSDALFSNATDIHFEPKNEFTIIRFRISGLLTNIREIDTEEYNSLLRRLKIISHMNSSETRMPQDGRLEVNLNDKAIDLRISTFPLLYGEKLVIRILDKSSFSFKFDELGLSQSDLDKLKYLSNKKEGLILFAGPTGSGKTTTMYSILNEISNETNNIVTIEDPIEYNFSNFNQSQINTKINYNYELALKSILRQDPDIIMLGEIRDYHIAKEILKTSMIGHLTLSTLHTNDGPGSIIRLINMGVDKYLISAGLKAVVSQRLVPKLCEFCKEEYILESFQIERLKKYNIKEKAFKANSCNRCRDGYSGYQLIIEIYEIDSQTQELIDSNPNLNSLIKIRDEKNQSTLLDSALTQFTNGNIDYKTLESFL